MKTLFLRIFNDSTELTRWPYFAKKKKKLRNRKSDRRYKKKILSRRTTPPNRQTKKKTRIAVARTRRLYYFWNATAFFYFLVPLFHRSDRISVTARSVRARRVVSDGFPAERINVRRAHTIHARVCWTGRKDKKKIKKYRISVRIKIESNPKPCSLATSAYRSRGIQMRVSGVLRGRRISSRLASFAYSSGCELRARI